MSPSKHSAICAEIQQFHQTKQSKLLARIAELEMQHKPLTDEEIDAIPWAKEGDVMLLEALRDFARAIEAAHGIKEKNHEK